MKAFLGILIGLVYLTAPVFAQGISNFDGNAKIEGGDVVHNVYTITFEAGQYTELRLPLFYDIQNFKSTANFDNLKCSVQRQTFGTDVICDISGITSDKRELTIEYDSLETIKVVDNQSLYKEDLHIPFSVVNFFFKVSLPEGMILIEKSDLFQPFLPKDGEPATDGRRILVFWKRIGLVAGEDLSFQAAYEPSRRSNSQGFFLGDTNNLIGVIVVIGASLAGLGLYWRRTKPVRMILPFLKSDEKKVFEALMKHGDGVNQKLIVRDSTYSKAKVSKVLKSLNERGLVKLERVGRTNKVYMVKEIQKKT